MSNTSDDLKKKIFKVLLKIYPVKKLFVNPSKCFGKTATDKSVTSPCLTNLRFISQDLLTLEMFNIYKVINRIIVKKLLTVYIIRKE